MTRPIAVLALLLATSACGGDDAAPRRPSTTGTGGSEPAVCEPDEWLLGDTDCVPLPHAPGCAPGLLPRDGDCVEPGVPPELCGEGFASDEAGGCVAIAPAELCASGQRAPLGQTDCRPIGDCGEGIWGAIPIEDDTQHVDASYAAGASDGSAAAPWTTIQQAIDAAAEGAIVAVAAGSYPGNLVVDGKAVRVWGRCPDMVEIVGSYPFALHILNGADGAALRGVAVTAENFGVLVRGSSDVSLDEIWFHDVGYRALQADAETGPTSVTLRGSLVERATDVAVLGFGAAVVIEDTEIRDTFSDPETGGFGRALGLQVEPESGLSSEGTLRRVVMRNNRDAAIWVGGSRLVVDDSWIVDTQPEIGSQEDGSGLGASATDGVPAVVEVRSSVVERQYKLGIFGLSSEILLDGVSLRQTAPQLSDGQFGRGVTLETKEEGVRSSLDMRRSLVEGVHQLGIDVTGGDFVIDEVLVRDVAAQASNDQYGRGFGAQDDVGSGERSAGTVTDSSFVGYVETGVFVVSSDVTLERVSVRESTAQSDSLFGDGIIVLGLDGPASAVLRSVMVDRSARAGVAAFGGSLSLEQSLLSCNPIDLNGQDLSGNAFSFSNEGSNLCGCDGQAQDCKLQTVTLEPPVPL